MTTRKKFEHWAKSRKLPLGRLQEVTRDGPRFTAYEDPFTAIAWLAYCARGRAK